MLWSATTLTDQIVDIGPLALLTPLLERLDIANIIDRHLPADPQQEYSHGQVLELLLAARLSSPVALDNVATWAEQSGAAVLYNIPADKLNDDRLGRSLDAFFSQRHSIQAQVAARVLEVCDLPRNRLHFDPTHLLLHGAYASSQPRPELPLPPATPSADFPAAHITHGYAAKDNLLLQVGVGALVDDLGAVPLFANLLDGNRNGHSAIDEHFQLLSHYLPPPPDLLMTSDRGTFSAHHVARLHRHGYQVLCSAPWHNYQALYDEHRDRLHWQRASFLSIEQQRRRDTGSTLPQEHYDLAVLHHQLTDPDGGAAIPCRVIFVYSTADAKVCRQTRVKAIAKIRAGLTQIATSVARGHARTASNTIARRVTKLLGHKQAARYFRWELVPLTAAEQAALPPPVRGCRRPTHRFEFHCDEAAAAADNAYDGLSVLVTTASRTDSADYLFHEFKRQNYVELLHHQWKTPLQVHPVFLKSPRRVEALVCLLQIALTAYQVVERLWRQSVPADAPRREQRMTAEGLLRCFSVCGLLIERRSIGRVVYATRLTSRQRHILQQLGFATPAEILRRKLPRVPES